MTAPSIGVKDLLVAAGVGVFPPTAGDWPIYISQLPENPHDCIALYDSGGPAPNPKWLLERPDVSVLVRGSDYAATYDKAKAIKDALLGLPAQTVGTDRWDGIVMVGDIVSIGYDDDHRIQFSLTFRIWVEPADTAGNNREPL